ncbi:hypothetical protein BD770DRAFT_572 [Pilaira anomala]|nr:hypothetical protein BD770DRAFT_572 [Pilaira anomala]
MDRDLPYIGYSYSCSELDGVTTKKLDENQTFITQSDTQLDNLKAQLIEKDTTIKQRDNQVEKLKALLTEKNTEITRIHQLELELQSLKKENKTMKQEVLNYQQQTITEKIPLLEKENKRLDTQNSELCQKLRLESIHSNDLEKQIKTQADLIKQSQSECAELKQELNKLPQQISDTKVKRVSKSLPTIPTMPPSSPRTVLLEQSTAEGRSLILSSMWQRDRELLRNIQHDLEVSESNLASSKRQILRLKKELSFYQKHYTEHQTRNKSQQQYPLPSTPPLDAIEFSPTTNEDELMDQIRREHNFIQSTKRTMSFHARLSRNHGEIDQELNKTLEQATKNLSLLESKLRKNQPQKLIYSPRDFFTTNHQTGK